MKYRAGVWNEQSSFARDFIRRDNFKQIKTFLKRENDDT